MLTVGFAIVLIPLAIAFFALPFLLFPEVKAFRYYCISWLFYLPLGLIFPHVFNQPNVFTYLMVAPIAFFLLCGWGQFFAKK